MKSEKSYEWKREISPERLKAYKALCGGAPDIISVLARGTEVFKARGEIIRSKTTGYLSKEVHGNISGSRAGVLAAVELSRAFPEAIVMANSFIERTGERHAQVTAEELERAGVPQDHIVIQEESFNTFSEIIELIKIVVQKDVRHAVVVVNEFIIPRAQALLERIQTVGDPAGYRERPGVADALEKFEELLRSGKANISFVSSEDVISLIDPRYKRLVEETRKLPAWQKTIEMEQSGVRAIEEGTYGIQPPSTSVRQ